MTAFLIDEQVTLDRSTLERWHTCAHQGQLLTQYQVPAGNAAESGSLVHDCHSDAITQYIASGGSMDASDIVHVLEQAVREGPPASQKDALSVIKTGAWRWAKWLKGIHPDSIYKYDGGEGERSGQLHEDIEQFTVTSELDFVCGSVSPEAVNVVDWKSGWKRWSAEDIAESFQFRMHAWLLFQLYQNISAVHVKIWMPRYNDFSLTCEFRRSATEGFRDEILSVLNMYRDYADGGKVAPTFPTEERCRICPVMFQCRMAVQIPVWNIAEDPGEWVDRIVVMKEKLSAMEKTATAWADEHGDIKGTKSGKTWGRNKPDNSKRKKPAGLY